MKSMNIELNVILKKELDNDSCFLLAIDFAFIRYYEKVKVQSITIIKI